MAGAKSMQEIDIVTQIFLPLSLAFIMFSLGLELTIADFKRVAIQPKEFIIGTISQMLLLPMVAFGLLSVWPMEPALSVGVMIIAACPGGVTSNLLTYLARGDTALSISLTAIISLLAVFTLPFIVGGSINYFMDGATTSEISIGKTILGVFAITTVPVIIGMFVKRITPLFAEKCERSARFIASILFVVIIIGAVLAEKENIVEHFKQAGPFTLVLNLVMMLLAAFLSKLSDLGGRQCIAITLECGLQNGTLAIFVAVTLIGNKTMMVPGGVYSLVMFASAIAYLFIVKQSPSKSV